MEHMLVDAMKILINPNFYTFLYAENLIDLMGRVARICHRSSLTLHLFQKYKLLLALHAANGRLD